jgi:hypothetical protein
MDCPPLLWIISKSKYFGFYEVALKLASGHRTSTTSNGQSISKKIAGTKVIDEYYSTYPKR